MGLLIKLALKELRNQKITILFFTLSLSTGLFAFLSVDSFKNALNAKLKEQSKAILAADIGVGSRQIFDQELLLKIKEPVIDDIEAFSFVIESFTMLSTDQQTKLVEIKAIDPNYPFYGEIELSKAKISSQNPYSFSEYSALLYPETLIQLGLKLGDNFQLGGHSFTVADKIIKDPSNIGGGFNFAPTVYISQADLKKIGLIKEGSTGYSSLLFKLKNNIELLTVENKLKDSLSDRSLRVRTPENSSEQVGRLTNYLSDYLSLASLVALFLAAFGCAYLYSSYLSKNAKSIALYNILGLNKSDVRKLYLIHSLIISTLSLIIACLLSLVFLPGFNEFGADLLNADIQVQLSTQTFITSLLVALIGSSLICYPIIQRIDKLPANYLINSMVHQTNFSFKQIFNFIPALIFFACLTFLQSKSFITSAYFLSALAISGMIIALIGILLKKIIQYSKSPKNFVLSWVSKSLKRNFSEFQMAYFCMAIGVILILLLPMLESSLQEEIKSPNQDKTPSLFLFDIQSDQHDELVKFLNNNNISIQSDAPMIRSRLELVNDQTLERHEGQSLTREQQQENRWRNRGYNLTYRERLTDSENIIDGEFWDNKATEGDMPEISIESRFAKRLDLEIGDKLEFSVEGIPVVGKISSVRKIRWTSFQPNFFLQFQPNELLNELPQTHVMAIKDKSNNVLSLQNELAKQFPSVSVIDVARVTEGLSKIIGRLSSALQIVGIVSIIVGLLIFFAMVNQRANERRRQANLLRILGVGRSTLFAVTTVDFVFLILVSIFSGVLLSLAINSILMKALFDSFPKVDFLTIGYLSLIIFIVGLVITGLGIQRALNSNPNELLKE